ncbi:MAG: UDP-N-acetylglucosamine 1-carboxyvinyltransferase [Desulfonatronovibrionaceae bacterium]
MDKLIIEGGAKLNGKIRISGSKNAALPILMAGIMAENGVRILNVPGLKDIYTTVKLLTMLGCEVDHDPNRGEVTIRPQNIVPEAPYDLVRTMRASVLCLGPLLGLLGLAKVAMPGGCAIGSRPVDMHLRALEQMGAEFELKDGYIIGRCSGLRGAHIQFDFPTVGGTENLIMAAATADGETVLENAAREPEVADLCNFLNCCGAEISGQGTSVLRITGKSRLCTDIRPEYAVMPDRIEAGTYMVAAGITNGELLLEQCPLKALDAVVFKLREMGLEITPENDGVRVRCSHPLCGVDVMTLPFPGFPTDMQAQIMALMTVSKGSGIIQETVFENRFMHALEMIRMGANIKLSGQNAMVRGVERLKGAPVMASDLRASAGLVLAGLVAEGNTEVRRIYHLDRGYERMEEKLKLVGAKIKRTEDK